MKKEQTTVDIDFAEAAVPQYARRGIVTMFMIMLGFTFFSASMWVGQELADGLDFGGFLVSLIIGGLILSLYTGLLGYVGAETGMSLDLLARKAFGSKGSYLPSAMISFTQIGWFGVGIAMFAIPVANELLGGSTAAEWALVIIAGACMTASAYFGIKSLTLISYIAVPLVAILGTIAMVMAVSRGDGTIIDQFAKSSGTLTVIGGAGLVIGSFVSGGTATPNFSRFARNGRIGAITTVIAFFIGNSLMFFFGAISSVYVGGNDIFEVMINLGLFYLAISGARPQYLDDQRQRALLGRSGSREHLRSEEKADGPHLRHRRHGARRLAVLELLRLAEYSELHAAPGRHHPRHELLHGPREVPGRRSHRDGQLVCGRRRHPGRRGCKCCVLGHRLHQRHDRSRCLLPDRPRPGKQMISYSG